MNHRARREHRESLSAFSPASLPCSLVALLPASLASCLVVCLFTGCAAAGRDQTGVELSPQARAELTAEIKAVLTAELNLRIGDELRGGDQGGPTVGGEGNRVTNLNIQGLASQSGIAFAVLLGYVFIWRPLVRERRERAMLGKLKSQGAP